MPPRGHKQSAATKAKISASLRRHHAARGVGYKKKGKVSDAAKARVGGGQFGGKGHVTIRAYGKPRKAVLTRSRSTGFVAKSGSVVRSSSSGYRRKGQ